MSELKLLNLDEKLLKDNPLRNFDVDPIDQDRVEMLVPSIVQDGFWGGVVARRSPNGDWYEIACGHTRVAAARKAKLTEANITVADLDDESMIRIYARENQTQRGNSVAAIAGSVASALRMVIRKTLAESPPSAASLALRRRLVGKTGVGATHVMPYLKSMLPNIAQHPVEEQIKNLKMSGAYTKMLQKEYEAFIKAHKDYKFSAASLRDQTLQWITNVGDVLHTACDQAEAHHPRIFDFEGVSVILDDPARLRQFRELVTSESMQKYLEIGQQAKLAEKLIEEAKEQGVEASAAFIRQNTVLLAMNAKRQEKRIQKQDEEDAVKGASAAIQMKHYMRNFARYARGMASVANRMTRLYDSEENRAQFEPTGEMRLAIDTTKKMVDKIHSHVWLDVPLNEVPSLEEVEATIASLQKRLAELERQRYHLQSEHVGYKPIADMPTRRIASQR